MRTAIPLLALLLAALPAAAAPPPKPRPQPAFAPGVYVVVWHDSDYRVFLAQDGHYACATEREPDQVVWEGRWSWKEATRTLHLVDQFCDGRDQPPFAWEVLYKRPRPPGGGPNVHRILRRVR